MSLKVSRQSCSSSNPCANNPNVSGCISESSLKSVGIGSNKLQKDAADGFIKMYADMPSDIKSSVKLTDSYRPLKVQCNIFDFDHYEKTGKRRKKGTSGTAVATPGGSNHGWGRAIDIFPSNVQKWIKDNGTKYGWCWGEVKSEPWHFTFCGPGPNRDKNCDGFCTGKIENIDSKSNDKSTTDDSEDDTTDDSKDKLDLLGNQTGDNKINDLLGFLNYFKPGAVSEDLIDKKNKIHEDVVRIKDIMKKIL